MTDGGAIAIERFRYQDWCTIYFALENFRQSPVIFEHIYCEQDKLDFEVWNTNDFYGYQVKKIQRSLTANEVNQIFRYYLEKAVKSGKENKAFWFIFSEKPKNSLYYLLLKLNGNRGVSKYHRRTEKYIRESLHNLSVTNFRVDYHCHDTTQIENMAYAISQKVLKQYLKDTDDIPTEVVLDFLARLRDEIVSVTTFTDSSKRIYRLIDIDKLIKTFLSRVKIIELSDEGLSKKVISGTPIKDVIQRPERYIKKPQIFSPFEGEEIKNHE